MRSEKETDPSERYLFCNAVFTDRSMRTIKSGVQQFMKDKEKDEAHHQFINWTRQDNEIAVLTMYAYTDLSLPLYLDCIFSIEKPEINICVPYTITQSVFNGWSAIDHLSHGHKHVIVLRFNSAIPTIFSLLPKFKKGGVTKEINPLGLCNKEDFEAICLYLS